MGAEHYNVLIIGAGVSGIGMACHMKMKSPKKTFAILERRQAMGGTWDLFRYPGIRSDSDMYTFGYNFRPWTEPKILADGPSIKRYVSETAREYGVDKAIQYGMKVVKASWSSSEQHWKVEALEEASGKSKTITADFVISCSGYYKYDEGYKPDFPGEKDFQGTIIHPQHWPENLNYKGKRVIIIGSGATAVTLVPAMAADAAHVTMLQRSPTYIVSIPAIDRISEGLYRFLPKTWVYNVARLRNIALQRLIFWLAKERPGAIKRLLLMGAKSQLGDSVDMKHFTPHYNPWDERLCVVPDGDLFNVIKEGKASIVTDHIEKFTAEGIRLKSGQELKADIIITATGLNVQMMGGTEVDIDGKKLAVSNMLTYKSVLIEGVPNAAIIFGYTNASWTLKVDIAAEYLCRLFNHMDKHRYHVVKPVDLEGCKTEDSVMGSLQSGYLMRAKDRLPKQGSKGPWKVSNDYMQDAPMLLYSAIEDNNLQFA